MEPKRAATLILAKMALADGVIEPTERDFLGEILGEMGTFPSVDALLAEAQRCSIEDAISGLARYEDRFLIALRVYLMARIDQHLDESEAALFQHLIALLGIKSEDRLLIEKTESDARSGLLSEPDPRIEAMYLASSFCNE